MVSVTPINDDELERISFDDTMDNELDRFKDVSHLIYQKNRELYKSFYKSSLNQKPIKSANEKKMSIESVSSSSDYCDNRTMKSKTNQNNKNDKKNIQKDSTVCNVI